MLLVKSIKGLEGRKMRSFKGTKDTTPSTLFQLSFGQELEIFFEAPSFSFSSPGELFMEF
jgi:hypothetical protein